MENLIRLSAEKLSEITSSRKGETKFGERIITVPDEISVSNFLQECQAKFVLFGIPEDVGVKANLGRCGTASAYENTLKSLVNIQHNRFAKGNELIVLGHLDVSIYQEKAQKLNTNNKTELKELYRLVGEIDKEVAHLVSIIVKNGKIPIAIGGGHNNSYGMIKGTALAKAHPINAINFDAHTDFRALEGRHSGNGFSYAYEEGFLDKYFIFGMHENYTSKGIFQKIRETGGRVQYNTYEQMAIRKEKSFSKELNLALEFVATTNFGIEIDMDSVENMPSSAMTLSGFSAEKLRSFLHLLALSPQVSYLHICEAAPDLADQKNPNLIGKLIAYLITDFIKAKNSNI
ncbi:MAG: formimidoylglutamase [Flavobacteriaceae bacterium]